MLVTNILHDVSIKGLKSIKMMLCMLIRAIATWEKAQEVVFFLWFSVVEVTVYGKNKAIIEYMSSGHMSDFLIKYESTLF